jgi:hypothetical protein
MNLQIQSSTLSLKYFFLVISGMRATTGIGYYAGRLGWFAFSNSRRYLGIPNDRY